MEFNRADYFDVWESDLSKFVSETYGRPWRMQQGEMLGQNTYREVTVAADAPEFDDVEHGEARLAAWLALPLPTDTSETIDFQRGHYLDVDVVMWDLCRRGLAPAGKYLIRVWW